MFSTADNVERSQTGGSHQHHISMDDDGTCNTEVFREYQSVHESADVDCEELGMGQIATEKKQCRVVSQSYQHDSDTEDNVKHTENLDCFKRAAAAALGDPQISKGSAMFGHDNRPDGSLCRDYDYGKALGMVELLCAHTTPVTTISGESIVGANSSKQRERFRLKARRRRRAWVIGSSDQRELREMLVEARLESIDAAKSSKSRNESQIPRFRSRKSASTSRQEGLAKSSIAAELAAHNVFESFQFSIFPSAGHATIQNPEDTIRIVDNTHQAEALIADTIRPTDDAGYLERKNNREVVTSEAMDVTTSADKNHSSCDAPLCAHDTAISHVDSAHGSDQSLPAPNGTYGDSIPRESRFSARTTESQIAAAELRTKKDIRSGAKRGGSIRRHTRVMSLYRTAKVSVKHRIMLGVW